MQSPRSLIDTLSGLLRAPLNSLDILPGGLPEWQDTPLPEESPKFNAGFPFLLVEGNLGIPKKVLYAIYLSAISTPWRASDPQTADAVSSIIILANPAHQTALNARKRLIIGGHLDPQKELALCELMARGSPEFGKQSMVWAHRRWCFTQIYGTMGSSTRTLSPLPGWASSEETRLFPRLSPASAQHELRLIQHTCETYPRNYHAWVHWHLVIDVCYASFIADNAPWGEIIAQECARLQGWINLHVSDYSAMHQLLQVQSILEQVSCDGGESPVEHALSLVKAFPSHESLWMYFRGTLGRLATEKRAEIVRSTAKEQSIASKSHEIIQLEEWFRKCEA